MRARLEARKDEIEAVALTRVRAIADPAEVSDPAYAEGLRAAVAAAVAYGIETTGREGPDPPIPLALLAQARMAARAGIPLDTVLRRYFAGYSLLGYFILEEATNAGITEGNELKRLLGAHAGLFDRLLAAVGEEYGRETEVLAQSTASRRQAERIERLLAGEQIDTAEIPYEFDGWHLGVVGEGAGIGLAVRELAAALNCRLLSLSRDTETTWVWLGGRLRLDVASILHHLPSGSSTARAIAIGEPAEGVAGWRLSHRQAVAALPIARRSSERVVRYSDIALLASAMQDDLLARSLRQLYIDPLLERSHDHRAALDTLHAYLTSALNASSAATALGVSRRTVTNRLRTIEDLLGCSIAGASADLVIALRLHGLTAGGHPDSQGGHQTL